MTTDESTEDDWTARWLRSVTSGESTMSQRKRSSIDRHGGGLDAVRRRAEAEGVHLLLLTDDHGDELLAASRHPFRVIC